MRIVSLLPACTEWVAAFGGAAELVGRSHACDYPPEIIDVPVVTRPVVDADEAQAVDEQVRRIVQEGLSPFHVDLNLLADLEPDVILTQTQCHVCAVSESDLQGALTTLANSAPRVVSMHADTMKQVLNQALAIGRVIGRTGEAMRTIAECEGRLKVLRDRLGLRRAAPASELPSVALLEWLEPPMTAGHWTPDLIALAGGRPVCAAEGTRSTALDWDELLREDPDVVALTSCGMTMDAVRRNVHHVTHREGWSALRAVRSGRVYLFDGNAYVNRPGPRLYRSIELLAAAIHGDRAGVDVSPDEMAPLAS